MLGWSGGPSWPQRPTSVPPGKPQLTTGARGNETEETTGPGEISTAADTKVEKTKS